MAWTDDPLALKYMGKALRMLQNQAVCWEHLLVEPVLFTVARLVTIAYMQDDRVAFNVHFSAFQQLTEKYSTVRSPDDEKAVIIHKRLQGYVNG